MSTARIPGTPLHTVAKILEGLADDCVVVHDQPIGRKGGRIDHIVVGPFGVLCLTGRHQRGLVTVTVKDCIADGVRLDVVSEARGRATAVGARLKSVSGLACTPHPVVVMIGAQLTLHAQPEGVTILTDGALPLWLRSLPQALDDVQQRALSNAVIDAATWTTKSSARRPSLFGARSTPAAPAPEPETRRVAVQDWALFETWVRTGEHRFYVHDPDGLCLAHYDVKAKELVLVNETVRGFAEAVLGPHMDDEHGVRIDPAIARRARH